MTVMDRKRPDRLTIGELSKRTGVSVKRLRFYSDEGLLPPAARSRSGYRLYNEAHVVRIELVRTLRDAGMSLEDIARVLRRDVTLEQALAVRLAAVEAHITGLQHVASAIRMAIRSGATEEHLRRIMMVTRTTNEERRNVVRRFYEKVVDGLPADPQWVDGMIEASTPPLPASPTPAQLDAWVEAERILADPSYLACRRMNAADVWGGKPTEAFLDAQYAALAAVKQARECGIASTSAEASALVDRVVSDLAKAAGDPDVGAMRARLRVKYDPRGARFWELVAIIRDDSPPQRFDEWRWLGEALGGVGATA